MLLASCCKTLWKLGCVSPCVEHTMGTIEMSVRSDMGLYFASFWDIRFCAAEIASSVGEVEWMATTSMAKILWATTRMSGPPLELPGIGMDLGLGVAWIPWCRSVAVIACTTCSWRVMKLRAPQEVQESM